MENSRPSEMQVRFINTIENEISLIIELRRKYNLGFKVYNRVRELLTQQDAILEKRYYLELKNQGNNKITAIAHLDNGGMVICHYTEKDAKRIAE